MNYTKKEREYYNIDRQRKCEALGITKNQYNWLRRKGEELRKVYEDNCNGVFNNEEDYILICEDREKKIIEYLHKIGYLFFYFQCDPRKATLYLDKKPIEENAYTNAYCIY